MLSICVPIYNFDVSDLVDSLNRQTSLLDIPHEIICIDDGSLEIYRKKNKEICEKYGKYIELQANIGRAKIRNLFLQHIQYKYLLFLDCDSKIISADFLNKYIYVLKNKEYGVICGGRIYDKIRPVRKKLLRWRYGHKRESMPADVRRLNPCKSFMTNNFVIQRNILNSIKFDERIVKYGHEDTLFGFQLKRRNIAIFHIDNPVLNGFLEDNSEFVAKTEAGLENLVNIYDNSGCAPELIEDVTLLKYYRKISRLRMTWIIAMKFTILKPILKLFLTTGLAPLWIFDFYKLGYFLKKMAAGN
jgi:hypothetical protein